MSKIHNPTEIWKDVKGFEGRYEISNLGRLKSIGGKTKKDQILNPKKPDFGGYHNVSLRSVRHGVKRKCIRVHQLVAEHFLEKPTTNKRLEIDHKDSNKLNNKSDNLRWITASEHRKITKFKKELRHGSEHWNALLNVSDVIKLRELHRTGLTAFKLSTIFGYHRRTIYDCIKYRTWTHIP